MKKYFLSLGLVAALLVAAVPVGSFAAEDADLIRVTTYWGGGDSNVPARFSGSLHLRGGSKMGLLQTLRFEPWHGDAVLGTNRVSTRWRSAIFGGHDGLRHVVKLDEDLANDIFIARFPALNQKFEVPVQELLEAGEMRFTFNTDASTEPYEFAMKVN